MKCIWHLLLRFVADGDLRQIDLYPFDEKQ